MSSRTSHSIWIAVAVSTIARGSGTLSASGAHETDLFGSVIAATTDHIVASVPARLPALKGQVSVFDRVGATWVNTVNLTTGLYGDAFGAAVGLDGDLLAIGSPLYRGPWTSTAIAKGRVSICKRDALGNWPVIYTMDGPVAYQQLGTAIAVSGNWIVAGGPHKTPQFGRAYFYKFDGTGITNTGSVTPPISIGMGEFGRTVAMSGGWAAIGAHIQDPSLPVLSGCVVLASLQSGDVWTTGPILTAPSPAAGDAFGTALAMGGDLLVIGAPATEQVDANADGAVYVYRLISGAWSLEATLAAPAADYCRHFGSSVAVNGSVIAVGAATSDSSEPYAGVVHIYTYANGAWSYSTTMNGSDDETFGTALAFSTNQLVVGVPGASVMDGSDVQERAGIVKIMVLSAGDLNGDGKVNGVDLGLLLSSWGATNGSIADLNDDGIVNGLDLGILLGNWHP